jgi:hypothetical protein
MNVIVYFEKVTKKLILWLLIFSAGFRGVVCGPEGAHLAGGCVLLKLG